MKIGMDVMRAQRFADLRDKRVGLLSHQAALTSDGSTSAQVLHRFLNKRLVALYGPEHGFFGQSAAGEHTYTQRHPDWNIPVYSLYGERRKPAREMLEGVDIVVCDLQDIGVRCYTYFATLRNMLGACAEAGVEVIVTDRPIPLPHVVDGPMPETALMGFIAPCPVPLVYGMTPAESAQWIKATLFPELQLTVMPMEGWCRAESAWDGSRPAFMPPSPGIKTWDSAMTYAATVFTEALPGIDCGRGTNLAFRVLGASWLHAEHVCARLKQERLAGVTFFPYRYVAATGHYVGQELDGIRLTVVDPKRFRPVEVSLAVLRILAEQYGKKSVWHHKDVRPQWFDTLYGTTHARTFVQTEEPLKNLVAAWTRERRPFTTARASALLYT